MNEGENHDSVNLRRQSAVRAAVVWGAVALAIYVGYMVIMGVRSGGAG